jgi:hypothetical protein
MSETPTTVSVESKPELTDRELVRAATNNPLLSSNKVKLGEREFTLVDLPYDDLLAFLQLLEPLIQMLVGTIRSFSSDDKLGLIEGLSVTNVLKYCGKELPEMVQICLKQTDEDITVEEIKKLGKSPLKIAEIVRKQVEQNQLVEQVTDFFAQILPMMKTMADKIVPSSETHSA